MIVGRASGRRPAPGNDIDVSHRTTELGHRQGDIRYRLKTPYRDGTMHVNFVPHDFIARLAAVVPKPRVNLTCFHGVFAPNSRLRSQVTPGSGGRYCRKDTAKSALERHAAMIWLSV